MGQPPAGHAALPKPWQLTVSTRGCHRTHGACAPSPRWVPELPGLPQTAGCFPGLHTKVLSPWLHRQALCNTK